MVQVDGSNRSGENVPMRALLRLVKRFARTLKLTRGELSLAFITPREMSTLNRRYRRIAHATDVLSFRLDGPTGGGKRSSGLTPFVGQLVLCPVVIRRRAATGWYDRPYPACLSSLAAHGLLHLLGYDHARPAERRRMERRERQLLQRLP